MLFRFVDLKHVFKIFLIIIMIGIMIKDFCSVYCWPIVYWGVVVVFFERYVRYYNSDSITCDLTHVTDGQMNQPAGVLFSRISLRCSTCSSRTAPTWPCHHSHWSLFFPTTEKYLPSNKISSEYVTF